MSKVVSIYDDDCTTWTSGSWWGSDTYVNQTKIDDMVSEGVKRLTSQSVELSAWTTLFPTVSGSTKVGIKVNNNNFGDTSAIDFLPQLVNATIKGLKVRGFSEANIWILDPSATISSAFYNLIWAHYPSVVIYDGAGGSGKTQATWSPGITVTHSSGSSLLCDQVGTLDYLVQMPIMKLHGEAGYTLTYKNCFGFKLRSTISSIHWGYNLSSNNTAVDLYANTNIIDKTKLIIGDAIYGGRTSNWQAPAVWSIFGNDWPKRCFFATDPVAIDSVMWDFINWQSARGSPWYHNAIDDAAGRGHGVQGHWDNTTNRQYTAFDYIEYDMDDLPSWETRTLFRP